MAHSVGDFQRLAVLKEVRQWYEDADGHGQNETFTPQWFLRRLLSEIKKAEGK